MGIEALFLYCVSLFLMSIYDRVIAGGGDPTKQEESTCLVVINKNMKDPA